MSDTHDHHWRWGPGNVISMRDAWRDFDLRQFSEKLEQSSAAADQEEADAMARHAADREIREAVESQERRQRYYNRLDQRVDRDLS